MARYYRLGDRLLAVPGVVVLIEARVAPGWFVVRLEDGRTELRHGRDLYRDTHEALAREQAEAATAAAMAARAAFRPREDRLRAELHVTYAGVRSGNPYA
jgi:hypothetical protein